MVELLLGTLAAVDGSIGLPTVPWVASSVLQISFLAFVQAASMPAAGLLLGCAALLAIARMTVRPSNPLPLPAETLNLKPSTLVPPGRNR